MEAADKFVIREHLNKAYVEQINTFIRNNSNPMTTRDASEKKKKGTTTGNSVSQVNATTKSSLLPMKKMLFFDAISLDGPKKKLLEFNSELNIFNESELKVLDSMVELIKNKAFYHSSKVSK